MLPMICCRRPFYRARRWLTRRRMERVRMEKMLWEAPLAKADIPSLTLAHTSTLFNLVPDLPTFASTASTSSSPGGNLEKIGCCGCIGIKYLVREVLLKSLYQLRRIVPVAQHRSQQFCQRRPHRSPQSRSSAQSPPWSRTPPPSWPGSP